MTQVNIDSLSPQEQRLFKLYGKIPSSSQLLNKKLAGGDRKYFDSGDYALCKASGGKPAQASGFVAPVGVRHPDPETIPHNMNFSSLRKNSIVSSSPPMYVPNRRSSIVTSGVMNASDVLTA